MCRRKPCTFELNLRIKFLNELRERGVYIKKFLKKEKKERKIDRYKPLHSCKTLPEEKGQPSSWLSAPASAGPAWEAGHRSHRGNATWAVQLHRKKSDSSSHTT